MPERALLRTRRLESTSSAAAFLLADADTTGPCAGGGGSEKRGCSTNVSSVLLSSSRRESTCTSTSDETTRGIGICSSRMGLVATTTPALEVGADFDVEPEPCPSRHESRTIRTSCAASKSSEFGEPELEAARIAAKSSVGTDGRPADYRKSL